MFSYLNLIIKNYYFLHLPSPRSIAIHIPPRLHDLESEARVELSDVGSIMIREHDLAPTLIKYTKGLCETSLHISTEVIFIVAREIRRLGESIIGRIEVDEVSLLGFVEDVIVSCDFYFCLSSIEELRNIGDIIFLDVVRIFVGTHRDIEFPATIDAMKSVETGTIQVDESRSSLDITVFRGPVFLSIPCADFEIFLLRVLYGFEIFNEFFVVVFDDEVGIDELGVHIGEEGFLLVNIEEYGTTSEEWFIVIVEFRWE